MLPDNYFFLEMYDVGRIEQLNISNRWRNDVLIPINKRINNVIPLLVRAVRELTRGYYNPTTPPMLYDKSDAKQYDLKDTISGSKIRNGTELIMI